MNDYQIDKKYEQLDVDGLLTDNATIFVIKPIIIILLCLNLMLSAVFPLIATANCKGILGPAHFSLYKNRQATFNSVTNADYDQKYKVEWFIGSKPIGSITKNGGESFILKGSHLSSQAFSITGSYKKKDQWFTSHYKIFPDSGGGIQVRFEDGSCDNSFETSPDLKVTINIKLTK